MVKPKALLLFHGAGGNKDHPIFRRIEEAIQIPVHTVNFSYRDESPRRPPPKVEKLTSEVIEAARDYSERLGVPSSHLLIGGRSMGGRVASMAVANGLKTRGLVLLSYPLHPVGNPKTLELGTLTQYLGRVSFFQEIKTHLELRSFLPKMFDQ